MHASSGPTQPEEFRLALSPDTEAGWYTRLALRERLADSLPARTLIDLTAVVTELVNNAVANGPQRPITVALAVDHETIRGEVTDQGHPAAALPKRRAATPPGALGLRVVDQLTARWGVAAGSTHVWFELPLDKSG
ncbi:MAG TPA: ATP-binding protein [Solirubrobacterales bacterium]